MIKHTDNNHCIFIQLKAKNKLSTFISTFLIKKNVIPSKDGFLFDNFFFNFYCNISTNILISSLISNLIYYIALWIFFDYPPTPSNPIHIDLQTVLKNVSSDFNTFCTKFLIWGLNATFMKDSSCNHVLSSKLFSKASLLHLYICSISMYTILVNAWI